MQSNYFFISLNNRCSHVRSEQKSFARYIFPFVIRRRRRREKKNSFTGFQSNSFDDYWKVTMFDSFCVSKKNARFLVDISIVYDQQWINVSKATTPSSVFLFICSYFLKQFYCNAHKKAPFFHSFVVAACLESMPAVLSWTSFFIRPLYLLKYIFLNLLHFQMISFSLFVFFILEKTMHSTTVPVAAAAFLCVSFHRRSCECEKNVAKAAENAYEIVHFFFCFAQCVLCERWVLRVNSTMCELLVHNGTKERMEDMTRKKKCVYYVVRDVVTYRITMTTNIISKTIKCTVGTAANTMDEIDRGTQPNDTQFPDKSE